MRAGYICRQCCADETFEVRERARDEGVENYVYHCGRKAGEDHGAKRPNCRAQAVDLKVPMSRNGIGFEGPALTEEEIRDIKNREAK